MSFCPTMEDTVGQVDSRFIIRRWGLRRDIWCNRLMWNMERMTKLMCCDAAATPVTNNLLFLEIGCTSCLISIHLEPSQPFICLCVHLQYLW